jgi:gas vesicle protein
MSKTLLGIFIGVFIGAVAYELIRRSNPSFTKKIETRAKKKIDEILDDEVSEYSVRA